MVSEYYNDFLDSSEKSIKEKSAPLQFKLSTEDADQFLDSESTVSRFCNMLDKTLENLDDEINRFENNFSDSQNSIFWASTYQDVFDSLKRIFKTHKIKSVRLPNINASTLFRELGIKFFLRDEHVELAEDSDANFFIADLMLSDTGSLLLLNQSNNSLGKLTNSKTNIFFTTIDRIIGNSSWIEVYRHLCSYPKGMDAQDMVMFRSSPNCNSYLFIIDNQRTSLLQHRFLRKALTCLHCGRCNEVCPVFQTVGETPYNNVFTGPIANVILPHLETYETCMHLAYACTLCGNCEEVCPISLPIRDMIIENRKMFLSSKVLDRRHRRMMFVLRKMLESRGKLNKSPLLKRHLFMKYLSYDIRKSRILPSFQKETFNKLYKNKLQQQ